MAVAYSKQSWYALRVRGRFQRIVANALTAKDIENFLPLCTVRRRWSDRVKEVEDPLFPGYVFCRIDPLKRMPVLTIPGVIHFVSMGGTPQSIADHEIEAVRTLVQSGLASCPWPFLAVGDAVQIEAGPLRGVEGILASTKDADRLVVSISLLQRSVSVIIDRAWVTPAGKAA